MEEYVYFRLNSDPDDCLTVTKYTRCDEQEFISTTVIK